MKPPAMAGWNLALRFAIEVVALIALAVAGSTLGSGAMRFMLVALLPLVAAAVWATFRVPGEAGSSGEPPIRVRGWVRLSLELALLLAGIASLWLSDYPALALCYAAAIIVHYAASLDRVRWLLAQ